MVTKGKWTCQHETVWSDGKTENRFMITGNDGTQGIFFAGEKWEDALANADLICTAVNACKDINPENPQAAADSIKDVYEALKEVYNGCQLGQERLGAGRLLQIQAALAKAERIESLCANL